MTIDRQERRNAIDGAVIAAMRQALAGAENDPSVYAVVLSGAGDRACCAGAELHGDSASDFDDSQTEIFPMTGYFAPEEQLRRFGNYWGQPCIVNELAIMDADGTLLEAGQVGKIAHCSPKRSCRIGRGRVECAQAHRTPAPPIHPP